MSEGANSIFNELERGLDIFKDNPLGGATSIGQKAVGTAVGGVKEITGAAAAEDANELAREQFEIDKARLDKERADATADSERRQVSLSKGAARARGDVSGTATASQLSTENTNTQTDFLGL